VTVVLHQARRERGLTRAELARRAQVSEQTLAKIEQGHSTDPGFTVVAAVAASLGLRLDDLVERARQAATAEDESWASRPRCLFDRGREQDLAAVGPAGLGGRHRQRAADHLVSPAVTNSRWVQRPHDTDRLFLFWNKVAPGAGSRLDDVLSEGRVLLTDSHDQQRDGLKLLARVVGVSGERSP
jgi:transcriptional regulator with XRE-family HTH domain